MATAWHVRNGHSIDHTPGSAVADGDVVVVGSLVGVAVSAIAAGVAGSLQITGVHDLPLLASDDVSAGAALYWDAGNTRLTLTASGNTYAGRAFVDAGTGVARGQVLLNDIASADS
ncbi:MAG: DUF2190 family protein [Planctomycetota bacterium]